MREALLSRLGMGQLQLPTAAGERGRLCLFPAAARGAGVMAKRQHQPKWKLFVMKKVNDVSHLTTL